VVVVVTIRAGLVIVVLAVFVVVLVVVRHGGQPFVRVPSACADAPSGGHIRCRSGKK
jgi:hypothetical protein